MFIFDGVVLDCAGISGLEKIKIDKHLISIRLPSRSSRSRPAFAKRASAGNLARFASEGWWACLDSNQEPDRYERRTPSGNSNKISVSRSRYFTFVRVCSRGFCRITGGMEDRRKPPTGLDRTGPRFVRHAAIGLEADSARTNHFGSEWHEPDQTGPVC